MDIVSAVVLGVVQGLTEFLPVSSDGHLLLLRHLVALPDDGLAFDAALHFGTALAVLVAFFPTWRRLYRSILGQGSAVDRALLGRLVIATLPAMILGAFATDLVATTLRTLPVAALGFLVSAAALVIADTRASRRQHAGTERTARGLTLRGALLVGVAQVLALLPGLSRSGVTISAGVILGLPRAEAVAFSFLLALPVTAGAGLFGLLREGANGAPVSGALVLAVASAFGSGLVAIRFLLRYVTRASFRPFVLYLLFVSLLAAFFPR